MDDFLFFFKSREEALRGRDQIQRTLDYLGLKRNPKKGDWEPTQQCRHLGLLVDTVSLYRARKDSLLRIRTRVVATCTAVPVQLYSCTS